MGGGNMNDCSFLFELFDFSFFSNAPYLQRNGTKTKTKGSKTFVPGLPQEWSSVVSKQARGWQGQAQSQR